MNKANIDKMVARFLSWPLPKDFAPDGGIHFVPIAIGINHTKYWPIGTHLFTAKQAREMIEYMLGAEEQPPLQAGWKGG